MNPDSPTTLAWRLTETEKDVATIQATQGELITSVAVLKTTVDDLISKVGMASRAADRMSNALLMLAVSVIVAALTFALSHA